MTPAPTNRMIRAGFWTDSEMMRWPLGKRLLYAAGLPAIAEPTGCLEDDPWAWKFTLFPADGTITVKKLEAWRDELVASGKLVPYGVDGRRCLYLPAFHRYQAISNVGRPLLPVPDFLEVRKNPKDARKWEVYDARTGERLQPSPKGPDTPGVGEALGNDSPSVKDKDKTRTIEEEANTQGAGVPFSEPMDVQFASGGNVSVDVAKDLIEEYGFDIALESVRRVKVKKSDGQTVHSFPALVRSIAGNLKADGWEPRHEYDPLLGKVLR